MGQTIRNFIAHDVPQRPEVHPRDPTRVGHDLLPHPLKKGRGVAFIAAIGREHGIAGKTHKERCKCVPQYRDSQRKSRPCGDQAFTFQRQGVQIDAGQSGQRFDPRFRRTSGAVCALRLASCGVIRDEPRELRLQ